MSLRGIINRNYHSFSPSFVDRYEKKRDDIIDFFKQEGSKKKVNDLIDQIDQKDMLDYKSIIAEYRDLKIAQDVGYNTTHIFEMLPFIGEIFQDTKLNNIRDRLIFISSWYDIKNNHSSEEANTIEDNGAESNSISEADYKKNDTQKLDKISAQKCLSFIGQDKNFPVREKFFAEELIRDCLHLQKNWLRNNASTSVDEFRLDFSPIILHPIFQQLTPDLIDEILDSNNLRVISQLNKSRVNFNQVEFREFLPSEEDIKKFQKQFLELSTPKEGVFQGFTLSKGKNDIRVGESFSPDAFSLLTKNEKHIFETLCSIYDWLQFVKAHSLIPREEAFFEEKVECGEQLSKFNNEISRNPKVILFYKYYAIKYYMENNLKKPDDMDSILNTFSNHLLDQFFKFRVL